MFTGYIMKNSKVYCLISVCSCFVRILKFYFFLYRNEFGWCVGVREGEVWLWYGGRLLYRCCAK